MTSVERVIDYTKLKCENGEGVEPSDDWPSFGGIQGRDVKMTYDHDLPDALQTLNFNILPREKVILMFNLRVI